MRAPSAPPDRLPREGETIFSRSDSKRGGPDYKIDAETGCWVWQKSTTQAGYPSGRIHRLYWERANRPLNTGEHIHHICQNTTCVNPAHLEPMDQRTHLRLHHLEEKGLTLDDIRDIRELGKRSDTRAEDVGDRYGVSRWTIRHFWNAKYWNDLLDGPIEIEHYKTCDREDCDKPCVGRRHMKYCSRQCRVVVNSRKKRARKRLAIASSESEQS